MKKIKLFDPVINADEQTAVSRVLKSRFWASGSGQGNVNLFEKKFSEYVGSKRCVAVNSGTSALHLALSLYDVKGKEIIVPSMSFVSTAHAALYNQAKPVFVDIDPTTLCLDPKKVRAKITKKTGAILTVHFGGMPSNILELSKICKENKIPLIEDAAHATGSSFNGKMIGSHGDAVCFSFHPVKNLAMPNGGSICLNNKSSTIHNKQKLESLRWCGISNRKGTNYDVSHLGWNFYMNEFSAAIGIEQLKKLATSISKKKKLAKKYSKQINTEQKMPFDNSCSYHLFWIQVNNRNKFIEKMNRSGIEVGTHYNPIHKMSLYAKKSSNLPITENIGKKIVSIPIHPNLSDSDVDYIISKINKFI
ncbi:MAG: DegT/DnrJ/EryC1/StrS family aminotransferase [Nitrosopumilus sp.]|uniref:DegT/DnrJ/EryC1/StrS family aminotransferase n=1 Tax=Nitrosopumilus sp. TaxID=2024843 RepID=UPI00247C16CB|nr:DegT/DnrJ/EryC1/StrS family aminotransferase [Nitrosopumilus sp.]MCV0393555.1 DegT/DnrJ/EryC1/StrS family aminotransferase [Nitrosopumilus sp.]